MIRALEPAPVVIEIPEISDEERAANVAALAEHRKNVAWWNAHADEVVSRYAGKYVCVANQELFVGDDPVEVDGRAKAAHPDSERGFLCKRIPTHQGPMIHALRRALGSRERKHLAADDHRRG
jgi:hypothetical protein